MANKKKTSFMDLFRHHKVLIKINIPITRNNLAGNAFNYRNTDTDKGNNATGNPTKSTDADIPVSLTANYKTGSGLTDEVAKKTIEAIEK